MSTKSKFNKWCPRCFDVTIHRRRICKAICLRCQQRELKRQRKAMAKRAKIEHNAT